MKTLPTCLLTLALLLILGVGSRFAHAARPAATPTNSVEQRSNNLTRYLTSTLNLSRQQQKAVAKSTKQYLRQMAALPAVAQRGELVAGNVEERLLPTSPVARIEQEYTLALARILTPGQYNAYSWLQMHQPESGQ